MRVLVAGGTGLIGRHVIAALLARGDEVVCLTRDAQRARAVLPADVAMCEADTTEPGTWQDEAAAADAVINLAGASVAEGRWTAKRRRQLRRSRVRPTAYLAEAARRGGDCVFLSASASGYYGDAGDRALTEDAEPGQDYLARLAAEWEHNALSADSERCRVVCLRLAVVLAREGGALPRLVGLSRRHLNGKLGSGQQYFPWVHVRDVVNICLFAIATPALRGAVNVVAPDPPRQRQFAQALAARAGVSFELPAPAWGLRLVLGARASMLLASQRMVPGALRAQGFRFTFPDLERAFDDLLPA